MTPDPTTFARALEEMLQAYEALHANDTPQTRLAFEAAAERVKRLHKPVKERSEARRDRCR